MTEADLTGRLMLACRMLMPHAEVLKHADRFNNSYPDMTVTWNKVTSWWETKFYDNEAFKSPETQEIKCKRLSEQGICHYIIYEERLGGIRRAGVKRVVIVQPHDIANWTDAADFSDGFNHIWVATFIKQAHLSAHENYRQER